MERVGVRGKFIVAFTMICAVGSVAQCFGTFVTKWLYNRPAQFDAVQGPYQHRTTYHRPHAVTVVTN